MRAARHFLGTAVLIAASVLTAPVASATPANGAKPAFGAALSASMRQLVRAIEADSPSLAQPLFFSESVYISMKTGLIADPARDYRDRLIALYNLDLWAYHQRLVGSSTSFIRFEADPGLATWIAPGTCENRIGYWHEPGVRLVVERDHQVVSALVTSLISWHGLWYVVHLGPNPRPHEVGTVAGFMRGPGRPGPGGGC